jgi:DNA processing protein
MPDSQARADWLRIALTPGIGPALFHSLISKFGSPTSVLGKSETELQSVPKIPPATIKALQATTEGKREAEVQREMEAMEKRGVSLLTVDDPGFPPQLKEIPTPPVLLFLRGSLVPEDKMAVAVVGTRRCDSYGLKMAREIAGDLAGKGVTIVSGLAHGIDAAAHKGALAAGGRTLAFLPCGFETIYPPEHHELAEEVVQHGALITEFTMKVQPIPRCFPPRNRLVSGISLGVLVVQAPAKSGAMITARLAMEQNREVFALPGRVNEIGSEGPHRLILDGAKLVRNAGDVLDELKGHYGANLPTKRPSARQPAQVQVITPESAGPQKVATQSAASKKTIAAHVEDPLDKRIVLRLEGGSVHIDRLAGDLDVPVRKISERLLLLEMRGIVRRNPGMSFDLA